MYVLNSSKRHEEKDISIATGQSEVPIAAVLGLFKPKS